MVDLQNGSRTVSLLDRHRALLPSWLTLYYEQPIELVRGEGRYVWDADGTRYLDFFGGILTTISGHGVPEVVDAIREQAGAHAAHLDALPQCADDRARGTAAALSGIPDAKVFFTTSGTEANEAALLAATCFRRSNQVLALRNSYHGRSFGTIAITANRSWSPTSLSGLQVSFVHGGYRLRSPYRDLDDDAYIDACVQDLRDVIDMCTSGDVACMIAEPIQGVGGFATPPDGFFGAMQKVLADYGILFISDEVQTGFGRTGEHFWGYQAHGIVPDLITVAKGDRQRPRARRRRRSFRRARLHPRQQHLDVRRQPVGVRGRAREPRVPACRTTSRGTLASRATCSRVRCAASRTSTPFIADVRGRGLMLAIECCVPRERRAERRSRAVARRRRGVHGSDTRSAACSSAKAASTATSCGSRRR